MVLRLTEDEYRALLKRNCAIGGTRPTQQRAEALLATPGQKTDDHFAAQLHAALIPHEREYRFLPERRFRFDFVMLPLVLRLAVEIDGQVHRIDNRWRSDMEKGNLAIAAGWRVYHFARDQVRSGEALIHIREALKRPAMIICNEALLTRL